MKHSRKLLGATLCCIAWTSGAVAAADASSGRMHSSTERHGAMSGGMDSTTVRQMQEALAGKGHDPGPADGVMGPRTRAALQAYQRSQNIAGASGADQRTLESLGIQGSIRTTPGGAATGMSGINTPGPTTNTSRGPMDGTTGPGGTAGSGGTGGTTNSPPQSR